VPGVTDSHDNPPDDLWRNLQRGRDVVQPQSRACRTECADGPASAGPRTSGNARPATMDTQSRRIQGMSGGDFVFDINRDVVLCRRPPPPPSGICVRRPFRGRGSAAAPIETFGILWICPSVTPCVGGRPALREWFSPVGGGMGAELTVTILKNNITKFCCDPGGVFWTNGTDFEVRDAAEGGFFLSSGLARARSRIFTSSPRLGRNFGPGVWEGPRTLHFEESSEEASQHSASVRFKITDLAWSNPRSHCIAGPRLCVPRMCAGGTD